MSDLEVWIHRKKKKNKLNHLEIETFFLHIKNLFYIVGYNLVKNSFLAENYKWNPLMLQKEVIQKIKVVELGPLVCII